MNLATSAPGWENLPVRSSARSECVVVIDDEPDVLHIICAVLEMEGFEAVCLQTPMAIRQFADSTRHPVLFLVDVMLPGISGIDLARELRAGGFPDTPMVAMSASSSRLLAAARSDVFEDTIPKPFELSTLVAMVEKYTSPQSPDRR